MRGGFGGHGAIGSVLEDFGVTTEDYREAASAVGEQLADSRPEVDRPLDDDERAALEAFAVTTRAAIAAELGIDATAFEQAYQDAKAEAQAEREARRAERLQALADALGVTVEDLQEAFESLRGQFGPRQSAATSLGGA
jgi:sugar phosphate isomerase/epimerase